MQVMAFMGERLPRKVTATEVLVRSDGYLA